MVSNLEEIGSKLEVSEKAKEEIDAAKYDNIEDYLIEAPMAIQILAGLMFNTSKM